MHSDFDKHHRRSIRLAGYDYTQSGAYFVTFCAFGKKPVFGRVLDGAMNPNVYGEIATSFWREIEYHFPNVTLDESVIMPNHFHGLLIFENDAANDLVGARYISPLCGAPAGSLGSVVGKFKAAVTDRKSVV